MKRIVERIEKMEAKRKERARLRSDNEYLKNQGVSRAERASILGLAESSLRSKE